MSMDLYNHFTGDKIICPYCRNEITVDDPTRVPYNDDEEKEYRCYHCGKTFNIIAEHQDIVWAVKKIEDEEYSDYLDENDEGEGL